MTFFESSSRSILLLEHDLFRKPVPTFRDHAVGMGFAKTLNPSYNSPGADGALDGGERGLGLGAVRAAGLRHVGAAAAALAAEHLGAAPNKINGAEPLRQIGRDTDDDAGLALAGDADDSDDAGADLLLAFIGEAAQILDVDALDRARQKFDLADGAHAVGRAAGGAVDAAAHG